MYPISNEAKALFEAEQPQVLRITGTDRNGVAISITDADIMVGSFSIDRYCCNGSKLEIGTAIAAEMTMKLINTDGRFNNVVFEGTELYVEIGIADWSLENPTVYWMPCGYFIPDEQPRRMDIITIHAMDRMQLLDRLITEPSAVKWTDNNGNVMTDNNGNEFEFNTFVAFPAEVGKIVKSVCELCNVPYGIISNFLPNERYTIPELPKIQTQTTYRNLIQWCAGIMGANAYMGPSGSLRFGSYEYNTDYVSVPANRYSSNYQENDITITGVQFTNAQNVVIVSGSSDYAFDLKGNLLAAPYISDILPALRDRYVGYTYRPFTASAVAAPYLYPMDLVKYTDKDGNEYQSVITNVNFGVNCTTEIQSVGETKETNSNATPTTFTPEQAQLITNAINSTIALDESLNQESIFNRLTNNGEAQGIYMQDGKLYINLTYARAGTLILGGLDNQNGVLQILDSDGNLIGYWDNTGANVSGIFESGFTDEYGVVYKTRFADGAVRFYVNNQNVATIYVDSDVNGITVSSPRNIHMDAGNYYVDIANDGRLSLAVSSISMTSGASVLPYYGITQNINYMRQDGNIGTIQIVNGLIVGAS